MTESDRRFSQEATKKAVLQATLENPLTLYSTGIGVLGGVASGLFGASGAPLMALVGGLGVGFGTWCVNFFLRSETLANRHIQRVHQELVQRKEQTIEELLASLDALSQDGGESIASAARQGRKQFELSDARVNTTRELLSERLNPSEITYGRYLGASEQVHLSILDNLLVVVSILRASRSVDTAYIEERLKVLESNTNPSEADRQEHEAIVARARIWEAQSDKVEHLLTQNEIAITQMDRMNTALAELKALGGTAQTDLETAIKEMEELAARVNRYAGT